jgi:hypothetical protein
MAIHEELEPRADIDNGIGLREPMAHEAKQRHGYFPA